MCLYTKIVELEYGANDNGRYYKFSDGSLICLKYKSFTGINITTAWGSLYETSLLSVGDWAYPFASDPYVTATCRSGGIAAFIETVGANATGVTGIYLCRPNSVSNVTVNVDFIAIGRWK